MAFSVNWQAKANSNFKLKKVQNHGSDYNFLELLNWNEGSAKWKMMFSKCFWSHWVFFSVIVSGRTQHSELVYCFRGNLQATISLPELIWSPALYPVEAGNAVHPVGSLPAGQLLRKWSVPCRIPVFLTWPASIDEEQFPNPLLFPCGAVVRCQVSCTTLINLVSDTHMWISKSGGHMYTYGLTDNVVAEPAQYCSVISN